MDIQKEKEAFKATGFNNFGLDFKEFPTVEQFFEFIGWLKAKSQSIPEGYVLVPKELPEHIAEAMALDRIEKPATETDPTWIKISEDAYKGQLQSKKWEIWRDYKHAIEAQEQSYE